LHSAPYVAGMASRLDSVPNRRAIIDRRALAEEIEAM
jgi:hypothetical protein